MTLLRSLSSEGILDTKQKCFRQQDIYSEPNALAEAGLGSVHRLLRRWALDEHVVGTHCPNCRTQFGRPKRETFAPGFFVFGILSYMLSLRSV